MLSDGQIAAFIKSEESNALNYESELSAKRAKLLDYYNQQPFGDEVEGQSRVVTSDVADTVEWMLPSLLRIFTQGKNIVRVEGGRKEHDGEAMEKELIANHIFLKENPGVLILHNMFKDALLQYIGVAKVFVQEINKRRVEEYENLSLEELAVLESRDDEITDIEEEETEDGPRYKCKVTHVEKGNKIGIEVIPPEEFLISKRERDFESPIFCGHRSPKTRSQLIEMGFDKEIVNSLDPDIPYEQTREKNARFHDYDRLFVNESLHSPNDTIYLGEYYAQIDVNGDGVVEYYKIFYASNRLLEKEEVDDHPFAVCVPCPIPHRAIGTCPAEQAADIQFRKSTLTRQMLDNIYQTNYPRLAHSNKVDLDDLLTPRPGGTVEIDTDAPDVAGHVQSIGIQPLIEPILMALERTDTEREIRTGVSRFSQGLDADSLNKTATGFKGTMEAGQQRLDLVARLFADGGIKVLFEKIIKFAGRYQDEEMQIRVVGKDITINPKLWTDNTNVRIDVGLGSGERQEKIINLNNILQKQEQYMSAALPIVDQKKIYNTLDKLVTEVGLKDVDQYFNNPEQPEELLLAINEGLMRQIEQMSAQMQNPLAEAEAVKAQSRERVEAFKSQLRLTEQESKKDADMAIEMLKLAQNDDHFRKQMIAKFTELELQHGQNVPGSVV